MIGIRMQYIEGYIPYTTMASFHISAGSKLVRRCIDEMVRRGCEEVVLEAEVTNSGALRLYQNLGFIKDKRLQRWVHLFGHEYLHSLAGFSKCHLLRFAF